MPDRTLADSLPTVESQASPTLVPFVNTTTHSNSHIQSFIPLDPLPASIEYTKTREGLVTAARDGEKFDIGMPLVSSENDIPTTMGTGNVFLNSTSLWKELEDRTRNLITK